MTRLTLDHPPVLYHGTDLDAVPSILRRGLRPGLARDLHGPTRLFGIVVADTPVVYLTGLWVYATAMARRFPQGAVLEVDVTGLELEGSLGGLWESHAAIPSNRISMLERL